MIWLRFLNWLERKVVGTKSDLPLIYYDLFRIYNFIRTGADLPCNQIIAEHQMLASKWYSKRLFMVKIGLFVARALLFTLLIYSIPVIVLSFIHQKQIGLQEFIILTFIVFIATCTFFLTKFELEKYRNKYAVSALVDCILVLIVFLNKSTSLTKMIEKLDTEQQKEAIRKIEKLSKEHPDIIGNSNTKQKNEVSLTVLDLSRKQVILSFLEDAAKYFEYYIPRHLSSGDKSTDDWFKNSMKQVAAALREKKKWILTPMEDTAEYLIAKMTSTLVFVVTDNWHALEREEPEKITYQNFTRRLLSFLSKFLKLSFVGLFPLLFLVILQQTQFAITGPVRDYAFIISLGWFMLTFLINVDSSISTKISLIKDFRSLFSSNDITPKP